MLLKELENIIARGENSFVEFKHKINFPEKIAREISAFANTKGGKLYIGVDDNKTIFGLKNADEEIFSLKKVVSSYLKDSIELKIEKIKISDKKDVLCIHVFESPTKPVYALESTSDRKGIVYVRVEDKSIKASDDVVRILKMQYNNSAQILVYGELERSILKLIEKNKFITRDKISDAMLISQNKASETLINMTLAGVLNVKPLENGLDEYSEK